MKKFSILGCLVVATALIWASQSLWAATLFNDDFEDGNTAGWSTSGGSWSPPARPLRR